MCRAPVERRHERFARRADATGRQSSRRAIRKQNDVRFGEGCKSCSFMMDHIAPTVPHLAARDIAFAAISHAPLAEILPFKARMGWDVNWVSAHGTDFNFDFQVSFTPEEMARGQATYNYRPFVSKWTVLWVLCRGVRKSPIR